MPEYLTLDDVTVEGLDVLDAIQQGDIIQSITITESE